MICKEKLLLVLFCVLLTTIAQNAYAYFDPGTGSMLIQILIALVGSCLLFLKTISARLKKAAERFKFLSKIKLTISEAQPIHRCCLLGASIGVYVALFYCSTNLESLTVAKFVFNIVLFTTFSIAVVAVCALLFRKDKDAEKVIHGLLFLLFIYYMRIPVAEATQTFYVYIFSNAPPFIIKNIFTIAVVAFFFVVGYCLSGHTNKVVVIIVLMWIFPTSKLVTGIASSVSAEQANKNLLFEDDTSLKHKPNVYLLLFDSYSSREGLKAIGLHVEHKFLNYLDNKDFTVYHNFFTNLQNTRFAMCTYFNMSVGYGNKTFYEVATRDMQRILAGKSRAFGIFKYNGYATKIIITNLTRFGFDVKNYLLGDLCHADSCFDIKGDGQLLDYFAIFNNIVFHNKPKTSYPDALTEKNYIDALRKIVSDTRRKFVYGHVNRPEHAPLGKGICNEDYEIEKYAQRLEQANSLITRSIDIIEEDDPNAIIILASDHGPYILNHCSNSIPLLTREEVAERQGAFLAIRWSKDYDGRYDKDIKSSANLFRYIFSYLAGHEKLLANKPDDDAFYQYKGEIIKSIDDGVILPPPAAELKGND